MPTENDHADWADAGESGRYRAAPPGTPQLATARLRRGRPRNGAPAGASPRRQVRLPQEISDRVDALADRWNVASSEVMRAAIAEYVQRHPG